MPQSYLTEAAVLLENEGHDAAVNYLRNARNICGETAEKIVNELAQAA